MDYEVFISLLALDSYNRGYDQSVQLDEDISTIGAATIVDIPLLPGSVAAGFYAIAYNWNGETIISYRGTDNPNPNPFDLASDIWSGWILGAGFTSASQAGLALAFHEAVDNATSNPIVTVGHSLGGGLAGFVGALRPGRSYGFDHMPFLDAAAAHAFSEALGLAVAAASAELGDEPSIADLITWLPLGTAGPLGQAYETFSDTLVASVNQLWPYEDTMTAFHLEGEPLEFVRNGDPVVLAAMLDSIGLWGDLFSALLDIPVVGPLLVANGMALGTATWIPEASVQNDHVSNYGVELEPVDLHSQALLTVLLFGERQWASEGGGSQWQQSVRYVATDLMNDSIGEAIGLVKDTDTRADPGDQMISMIAYSLIKDGERVFGDTAIRALFDDMDDLGASIPYLSSYLDADVLFDLGNVLVEYAGLLAVNKALSSQWSQALGGVLESGQGFLHIDLSSETWSLGNSVAEHDPISIFGLVEGLFMATFAETPPEDEAEFVFQRLNSWLAERPGEGSNLLNPLDSLDSVTITLTAGQLYGHEESTTRQLIVGSDDVEQFTITGAPAIVLAAGGNDTIFGTEADDALIGGDGDDELAGGLGSDFLAGGGGDDTATYAGSEGPIHIRYVSDGESSWLTVEEVTGSIEELSSIETIVGTGHGDYLWVTGPILEDTNLTINATGSQALNRNVTINGTLMFESFELEIGQGSTGAGHLLGAGGGQVNLIGFHTNIIGSDHDDTIIDNSDGRKKIDGGEGDDTISAEEASDDVVLWGGEGNDTITGGSGNDMIFGGGTVAVTEAAGPSEILRGGAGSDYIVSAAFVADIDGGSGDDYIRILSGTTTVRGGAGNDFIEIDPQWASLDLHFGIGDGHDELNWSSSIRLFLGDPTREDISFVVDAEPDENNFFSGETDIALVITATGDSIFIPDVMVTTGVEAPNTIALGFDIDGMENEFLFDFTFGSVESYRVGLSGFEDATAAPPEDTTGTEGDDNLGGGLGDDDISGGAGNDTISASGGNDSIDGGEGEDTLEVFGSRANFLALIGGDAVVLTDETGREGIMTLTGVERVYFISDGEWYWTGELVAFPGTAGDDTIEANEFENAINGLAGNDTLSGMAGDDNLLGGEGDDLLQGGEGSDELDGGTGADEMAGGADDDSYVVDDSTDVVIELADDGYDFIEATISYVLGDNVEGLALSGTSAVDGTGNVLDNEIYGNGLANTLLGRNGSDWLDGGDGDDTLNGGAGADVLVGGLGSDYYYVDRAEDVVVELADEGTDDRIFASASYTLGEGVHVERLRASGTESLDLTGNALDNDIRGNAGDNVIDGQGGNDILRGYEGQNTLIGGLGDDYFYVDSAGDVVVEGADDGADDRIFATVDYTLGAGVHVEVLKANGSASIDLTGNELDNAVRGNAGDNVLDGNGGNDTLRGFEGADIFVFTTALGPGNVDLLDDYSVADDTIHLDDAVFAGLAAGALAAGAFNTGTAATEADDRIVYDPATGALWFDADGSGAGAAVQFATLSTGLAISAAEFVVV